MASVYMEAMGATVAAGPRHARAAACRSGGADDSAQRKAAGIIVANTRQDSTQKPQSEAPVSSDDYTLTRIASGDPSAVADCMKQFSGLVWSLVRSKLGSSADAEDLTQDIFIEVWKSAERFNPEAGSEAVLIATIARRRIIDRLRAFGRKPDTEEFDETLMPGTDSDVDDAQLDARRAKAALSELQEDHQALILMGVVEGMSHSEIATATGKPLGTVKTQMRRGLAKIRARLEEQERGEPPGAAHG